MSVSLRPYRRVLALPGVRASVVVMFLARIPVAAMGIALTLHVVIELGRGYGAAGLVGGLSMAGAALGSPFIGRMLDRHGLRPVVAVCTAVSAAFWMASPWLSYKALLVVALPAGMLSVPSRALAKQVLAALVPAGQRRTAYALDSMSVEVSFMVAPAGATVIATQVSTTVALTAVGATYALTGAAIWATNPPLRAESEPAANRTPLRAWLTPKLRETLLVVAGALFVMAGMEIALLAALQTSGDLQWTGLVIAILCLASIIGGLIHGGAPQSLSQLQLMALLSALTIPVALFDQPWWVLALALVPMALACAPTSAATSETVTDTAPAHVRGEAVGLQDAATKLGIAVGSPIVGLVIDHSSAPWGFIAAGGGGLVFAAAAYALSRRSPRRQAPSALLLKSRAEASASTRATACAADRDHQRRPRQLLRRLLRHLRGPPGTRRTHPRPQRPGQPQHHGAADKNGPESTAYQAISDTTRNRKHPTAADARQPRLRTWQSPEP